VELDARVWFVKVLVGNEADGERMGIRAEDSKYGEVQEYAEKADRVCCDTGCWWSLRGKSASDMMKENSEWRLGCQDLDSR
jgi:hypothetical protein